MRCKSFWRNIWRFEIYILIQFLDTKAVIFTKLLFSFFFLGEFVTTHSIINAITDFHANQ